MFIYLHLHENAGRRAAGECGEAATLRPAGLSSGIGRVPVPSSPDGLCPAFLCKSKSRLRSRFREWAFYLESSGMWQAEGFRRRFCSSEETWMVVGQGGDWGEPHI